MFSALRSRSRMAKPAERRAQEWSLPRKTTRAALAMNFSTTRPLVEDGHQAIERLVQGARHFAGVLAGDGRDAAALSRNVRQGWRNALGVHEHGLAALAGGDVRHGAQIDDQYRRVVTLRRKKLRLGRAQHRLQPLQQRVAGEGAQERVFLCPGHGSPRRAHVLGGLVDGAL